MHTAIYKFVYNQKEKDPAHVFIHSNRSYNKNYGFFTNKSLFILNGTFKVIFCLNILSYRDLKNVLILSILGHCGNFYTM